jgi:hypothetical protein
MSIKLLATYKHSAEPQFPKCEVIRVDVFMLCQHLDQKKKHKGFIRTASHSLQVLRSLQSVHEITLVSGML